MATTLSADMFFLMQTSDGRRLFAGHDSLASDFLAGNLNHRVDDQLVSFPAADNDIDDAPASPKMSDISDSTFGGGDKRKSTTPDNVMDSPAQKVAKKGSDASDTSTSGSKDGRSWRYERESKPAIGSKQKAVREKLTTIANGTMGHCQRPRTESVIIRNLPETMADANVKSKLEYLLNRFGCNIKEVRIIRKSTKDASGRYALVICNKEVDQNLVLKTVRNDQAFLNKLNFNCTMLAEKVTRIDEFDHRATRTLRVSNIREDMSKSQVREIFEPFGEIYTTELRKNHPDPKKAATQTAYVQFATVESAVDARQQTMGRYVHGTPLLVGFSKSNKSDCLILSNFDVTYIQKLKGRFGTLQNIYSKSERRQALLFFRDIECASVAMSTMSKSDIAGPNTQIDYASKDLQDQFLDKSGSPAVHVALVRLDDNSEIPVERVELSVLEGRGVDDRISDISDDEIDDDDSSTGLNTTSGPKVIRTTSSPTGSTKSRPRLFVGNLEATATEADIRTAFEPYGTIASVELKPQENDAYCFITFEDDSSIPGAMDAMNGKKIGSKEIVICTD